MGSRALAPEAHVKLQISLDRVRQTTEACHVALARFAMGDLSRDSYEQLLRLQREANETFERRHRKYFGEPRSAKPEA